MSDRRNLQEAVATGDLRTSLVALRDYLANELEGSRCNTCQASRLRTGDQAALVLRLTDVIDRIEQLPREDGQVSDLDRIRARRSARTPEAQDSTPSAKRGLPGS